MACRVPPLFLGLTLLSALALALSPKTAANADSHGSVTQEKASTNKSDAASNYAGAEACKACHAAEYTSWEKSPHWKTTQDTKEGPSHQGCEGCHGAAAAHVSDPTDTSKLFIFEKASAKDI
ncbi:MAG: hypothetical protein WBE87_05560, partial [Candidatus Acidiferrales bacterium]